jgi:hypothetical protein
MRSTQERRSETETFEKRLRAYAAGAGAVAAGLVAFSPPAGAEVVVVPAHVYLGGNPFPINIEGTSAVTLTNQPIISSPFGYCGGATLFATAASGAGLVGHGRSGQVAPLKFGVVIGPADQFEAGKQLLALAESCRDGGWYVGGPFANAKDRFVGFKFELGGEAYYGWAGFSVVDNDNDQVLLTAYAYETEPNTPIYAGQSSDEEASDNPRESRLPPANGSATNAAKLQPASLGVLALGSLGLNVWRKRETGVQESS